MSDRPVLEFRPLPELLQGRVRRYADGQWLDDDGEYDLAFIFCDAGAPICLYVGHPYKQNIVSQWFDTHWSAHEPRHPRGNAWHYALADGAAEMGGNWDRDRHPNTRAGEAGMSKLVSEHRCANGRHVEPHQARDRHVAAGLVRHADTQEPVSPVSGRCFRCGDSNDSILATDPTP